MEKLSTKDMQELINFYKGKCSDIEYQFLLLQIISKNNLEEKLKIQQDIYNGEKQRAENEFFVFKNNLNEEIKKLKKEIEKNKNNAIKKASK